MDPIWQGLVELTDDQNQTELPQTKTKLTEIKNLSPLIQFCGSGTTVITKKTKIRL
jgi:hypothetical protein